MNVIFMTQSSSLKLFSEVKTALQEVMPLEKVGYYAADSRYYAEFSKSNPNFENSGDYIVKEWEIVAESRKVNADIQRLRKYEKDLGTPCLWDALVADRRIYFGKNYAFDQDYASRYTHERMLGILQIGLSRMEQLFDEVQPDFVISFVCVTLGEYLAGLFAKSRSIPFLNLRPTRIRNYIYVGESVLEPSEDLVNSYNAALKNGLEPTHKQEAEDYLREVREQHNMYEGVVPTSAKPPVTSEQKELATLAMVKTLGRLLAVEWHARFGKYKEDNHISGSFAPLFGQKVVRPFRAWKMERTFRGRYVYKRDLKELDFAFFPLHTEPEVTLSVYSKAYLNQIEVIRNISHNLPVGMKLLVKEHPWSIGKRPVSYYKKLLLIPNVLLAHPTLTSRDLVSEAKLVTVIAGSIALEAVMVKKPVVVFGRVPFTCLPKNMICHIKNPAELGRGIRDLLENYKHDEKALLSYIATVMKLSVPVDFYSKLLGRKGVFSADSGASQEAFEKERREQIRRLARYFEKRYYDLKAETVREVAGCQSLQIK